MHPHYPEVAGKWRGYGGEHNRCAYIILQAGGRKGGAAEKYIYIILESRVSLRSASERGKQMQIHQPGVKVEMWGGGGEAGKVDAALLFSLSDSGSCRFTCIILRAEQATVGRWIQTAASAGRDKYQQEEG